HMRISRPPWASMLCATRGPASLAWPECRCWWSRETWATPTPAPLRTFGQQLHHASNPRWGAALRHGDPTWVAVPYGWSEWRHLARLVRGVASTRGPLHIIPISANGPVQHSQPQSNPVGRLALTKKS